MSQPRPNDEFQFADDDAGMVEAELDESMRSRLMRTSVFTFWQMPEEEVALLDFLDSTGAVVAYPAHWVKTLEEASPCPVRSYLAEHNPDQVDLGLGTHDADVTIESQEKGREQFFYVTSMQSCLIGYSRPRFRSCNQLGQSNLAAYLDVCKESVLHAKPDWFQSWVKQVFSWAKKRAKKKHVLRGFGYPATPLVLKAIEEKHIEAVL
ncbi:hypothetical protein [Tuwongella immobilis]|uniref:Uncharacterized protein n=1 Tax=Tuwongella immobilis TaxID=692036 RepID=A0A6C2YQX2_9BACT|nr:hypothetical protein [Tuwongella immobilis]VIP03757.1 unnamed protein product [Tuwongella immobilis]VTS04882.1 unnamed protein product [Tuwongella immobilis]